MFSEQLHDPLNLTSKTMKIRSVKDLCVVCMMKKKVSLDEKEYLVSITTLKQAPNYALILQKVYWVIKFN